MGGSRATTAVDLGSGKATINYGTPVLGSRNLDDMIKPGMAWRMGSNDATTLETTVDLDFGGKKLAAGKYTLFARPDEKQNWTLLVSNGTGAMFSAGTLVLEAPLRFARESASQDVLQITLKKAGDGADMHVAWGAYRLQGSFKPAR
jgi:hypothetical protein